MLEHEIVSLQIPPSSYISENALCARFQVSRTIVRSALQHLSQNGFVEIIPRVGTVVTPIDLDAVNNFIYLRVSVESSVLRDFLQIITPPQLEEIRFHKDRFQQAVSSLGDLSHLDAEKTDALLAMDLEFHHCYFRFMGKSILWNFLTKPHPNYSRFIRLDMLGGKNIPDVLREHESIMALLEQKNSSAIEDIISRHLYGGTRRLGSKLYSEELQDYIKKSSL